MMNVYTFYFYAFILFKKIFSFFSWKSFLQKYLGIKARRKIVFDQLVHSWKALCLMFEILSNSLEKSGNKKKRHFIGNLNTFLCLIENCEGYFFRTLSGKYKKVRTNINAA